MNTEDSNNHVRWGFVNNSLNLHPDLTREWTMVNGEGVPIYFARPAAHPIRLWMAGLLAIAVLFAAASRAFAVVPAQPLPAPGTTQTSKSSVYITAAMKAQLVKAGLWIKFCLGYGIKP